MTRVLAIAARDLRQRSFVFTAAAFMAAIPFLAALLPYTRWSSRGDVISVGGVVVSIGFTYALAMILGGSFVGRDLSERRLSFYFSKPVSAAAIWVGKLVAAVVTIGLCFGITFLPSFLITRRVWAPNLSGISPASMIMANVTTALCLLLVAHAGSTMVRSRSPRVALDLLLLCAVVGGVWLTLRPLFAVRAMRLFKDVGLFILAGLVLSVLLAGWWQLAKGRTEIRRSHSELSRSLWICAGAIVLIAALYVAWVFSAGPRDIDIKMGTQNARGDWMILRGPAHHRGDYEAIFLVNLVNGRWMRFEPARWGIASFTRRGDAAVAISPLRPGRQWNEPGRVTPGQERGELYVQRLDAPASDADTGIQTQTVWAGVAGVALSDDLSRVAIAERGLLSVHDLSRKALLASVRLPMGAHEMFFASPDVVRFYSFEKPDLQQRPVAIHVYEFDVRSRRLQQTGERRPFAFLVSNTADGTTALLNERGTIIAADGRTLAERFAIAGKARAAIVLRSGGVATLDVSDGNGTIRVFDARGVHLHDIALGRAVRGGVREIVPGKKLLAAVYRNDSFENPRGMDLFVIDFERGVIERREHELQVLCGMRQSDVMPSLEYIVTDASRQLWRWNALTGVRTRLF
ncbi:MAG TPA: hypothetical protein VGK31_05995 [Thermoanaerobaculia bacterium]